MNPEAPHFEQSQIRPAKPEDAAAIAAIYAEHVRTGTASFETVAPDATFMAEKIAAFARSGRPFLVMEIGGEILGYAYACQFRDRAAYAASCEDSIYIRGDVRGQGVGSKLLTALIEETTARGFRQMIAVIGGGEPASIALHAKMGFVHAGRMRSIGRKFGRWLDTVYMQLALGAGDSQPPDKEPV
jgi:phosphinothricin acetyltransferase